MHFDRRQALASAMSLFWRKGYEATSLQDLLKATGLSKSSLYQTFGSKRALFERSLDLYRREMAARMREMLDQAHSGRAFIERMVYGVGADTRGSAARRGCLVMNAASEFAQSDPQVARLVKQGTRAFAAVFEAAVVRARDEGEISSTWAAGDLARYPVTGMSGLKAMVKAGATPAEIESSARVILSAPD